MSHEVLIGDGLPVVADDGIVGASPEIRRSHRAYKDAARAQESHASLLVPDFDAIDDEPGSPEDPRISATADEEVYERQSEVYEDKDDPRAEAFRSSQRVLSDRVSAIMSLSKEQLKSDSKADMKVPSSSMIISCPDDSFAPEDPRGHKLADDECLDFQEQQQFRPQNPLTISPKKPSQILVVKSSPAGEKMTADMELASFFLDQQGRSAASSIDDRTTPSSSSQGVSSSFGNFDASDRAPYASRPTSEEILAASRPTSQDVLYASRPVSHESQESRMISSNSFLSIREALPPNDDQDDVGSPSQRVSSSELDVVEISLINDENANDDDLARARSMLVAEDSKEEDPRFRHDLAEADRGHT